ncbi:MAG TPA: DUF475 domain-containing protein [Nanoarchaeota archaeon]|nr:DUF475 domain-containing protein [Nanoarchaeota archaeon]
MDIASLVLIVIGLALFETINSIDNAVINAEVLGTMSPKGRKWFLIWGLLTAVFLVRGLLPLIIIWGANPSLGFIGSLTATFSSNPMVKEAMEASAPILLSGAGIFLLFLFFHWLFLETKSYGLHRTERFFERQGVWFFAIVSIILAVTVWYSLKHSPMMAFGAVLGSTAFFITHGFKQNAEKMEEQLLHKGSGLNDMSKIMFLEVIDATFSIDGVLGAFAFTLSVPLIILGNGLGALVVRQLTISNIERVKRYKFLKNGAMYSVFVLGMIMLLDSFGMHIPAWLSPVATFFVIGYFFWRSKKALNAAISAKS